MKREGMGCGMSEVAKVLVLLIAFFLGMLTMRWHENEKGRAVKDERRKTEWWRAESERLRIAEALAGRFYKETPPPMPMQFGEEEERELKERGGFVRKKMQ